VYPNPPHVWSERALGEREASVLELSARGMPGKLVAYTLGISQAMVSRALATAAAKVGCGSRNALVRLAADVLRPDGLTASALDLTSTEREVLQMLRAGWSDAAIAAARGTSTRTASNQVGALLRKTGLASRRGLAALPSDD
jgi:DNA-binding NarL/FixJ family response regulator